MAASPLSSSEAEMIASEITRLKNDLKKIMRGNRESNLNLPQIHTTGSINVDQIPQMFIKNLLKDCLVF